MLRLRVSLRHERTARLLSLELVARIVPSVCLSDGFDARAR